MLKILIMCFLFQLEELDVELNYIKELYELAEEFEIPVYEGDTDNYDVNTIFILTVLFINSRIFKNIYL